VGHKCIRMYIVYDTYMYVCVCVCVCLHAYIHTYTCIHSWQQMCQGVRGQQWAGGRLVLAHEEPVAAPEVREVHWAGTVGRREGDEPAEVKGGKGGFIGGKGGFIGGKGGFIHEGLFKAKAVSTRWTLSNKEPLSHHSGSSVCRQDAGLSSRPRTIG